MVSRGTFRYPSCLDLLLIAHFCSLSEARFTGKLSSLGQKTIQRPNTNSDDYAASSSRGITPCWERSSAPASPSRCTIPLGRDTSNEGIFFTDAAQGLQHHHEQALGLQQPWRMCYIAGMSADVAQWMLTDFTASVEGYPPQVH